MLRKIPKYDLVIKYKLNRWNLKGLIFDFYLVTLFCDGDEQ